MLKAAIVDYEFFIVIKSESCLTNNSRKQKAKAKVGASDVHRYVFFSSSPHQPPSVSSSYFCSSDNTFQMRDQGESEVCEKSWTQCSNDDRRDPRIGTLSGNGHINYPFRRIKHILWPFFSIISAPLA